MLTCLLLCPDDMLHGGKREVVEMVSESIRRADPTRRIPFVVSVDDRNILSSAMAHAEYSYV